MKNATRMNSTRKVQTRTSMTPNDAAAEERSKILKNAKRCFRAVNYDDATAFDYRCAFEKHIKFIETRVLRNAKKAGGLGRR